MNNGFTLTARKRPTIDEHYAKLDRPKEITHRGNTYQVHGTVLCFDTVNSDVRVWVPVWLASGGCVYVYDIIPYKNLTPTQQKKFFPVSDFRKIWGKSYKPAKVA